jgi:hypothetical protein
LPVILSLLRICLAFVLSASTVALATPLGAQEASPAPSSAPGASSGPAIVGVISSQRGPIAGAAVSIQGPVSKSVTTGADGAFRFTDIPAGAYKVSATAPGFQPLRNTPATASASPQPLTITLATASLNTLRTIASTSTVGRGSVAINTSGAGEDTVTSQTYLDRAQTQVQDLLEEQPGVELARFDSSAPGANVVPAVRGASPYETQVLIDGHPVSGGVDGDFLVQFLNPSVLGSVEVDKGPGVFGTTIADAIGGTVNFLTPTITSTLQGQLTAGYDSFNGTTYSARVSDTIGKLGVLAAYGFDGTPGYFSGDILSVSASGAAQAGSVPSAVVNEAIPSSETYQNRSEVFKLSYNLSPTTQLTLGSLLEQSYVDYTANLTSAEPVTIVPCLAPAPVPGTTGPPACQKTGSGPYNNPTYNGLIGQTILASTTDDPLYLGNYEYDNEPIFTADLRTTIGPGSFLGRFYTGDIERDLNDPEEAAQITACNNPACTKTSLSGAFYEAETDKLSGSDFQYSIPFARDGQDLATASYDEHSDKSTDCEGGTAVFTTAADCGGPFNLTIKSQTASIRALANVLPKVRVGFANYFSNTTFVGSRYDPRATLVWTPQKNTAVRFAVGTSYVAPPTGVVAPVVGLTKAVVDGTLEVADALKPESSAGVDIGADFGVHGDSKFTVDAYETALSNRFSTITIKPSAGQTPFGFYNDMPFNVISEIYNASDATEEGVEFTYTRAPRVGLGALVDLDLLRAYNYNTVLPSIPGYNFGSGSGGSNGQVGTIGGDGLETPGFQIPGYPYWHGRLQVSYTFPSAAQFTFGQTIYGANNSFGEAGFSLFDFNTSLPLRYGVKILGTVTNIFDHDNYRSLSEYGYGYLPPGETTPYNLLFAPPRTVTLQLVYPIGGR